MSQKNERLCYILGIAIIVCIFVVWDDGKKGDQFVFEDRENREFTKAVITNLNEAKAEEQKKNLSKIEIPQLRKQKEDHRFSRMKNDKEPSPTRAIKPKREKSHPLIPIQDLSKSMYALRDFGKFATNQTIEYDYDDITYPVPFNKLFRDEKYRYSNFGKTNSLLPSFVGLGQVEDSAFEQCDFIAVTGSSENHLYSNINTMYTLIRANFNTSIVFVDFGISKTGLQVLVRELTRMHALHLALHSPAQLYYRKFDFTSFPDWYDIQNVTIRGGYSWKVISYYDVLEETKRIVMWSDGGNSLPLTLKKELFRVKAYGIYTPYSGTAIQSYLHAQAQRFLVSHSMVRKVMVGKGMCTGGYVFIDYQNTTVMQHVIAPLLHCVYTRRCVSPYGSNRRNHRQDQSILSVLVNSARIPESCNAGYKSSIRYHQECNSDANCRFRREQLIMEIKERYLGRNKET